MILAMISGSAGCIPNRTRSRSPTAGARAWHSYFWLRCAVSAHAHPLHAPTLTLDSAHGCTTDLGGTHHHMDSAAARSRATRLASASADDRKCHPMTPRSSAGDLVVLVICIAVVLVTQARAAASPRGVEAAECGNAGAARRACGWASGASGAPHLKDGGGTWGESVGPRVSRKVREGKGGECWACVIQANEASQKRWRRKKLRGREVKTREPKNQNVYVHSCHQ